MSYQAVVRNQNGQLKAVALVGIHSVMLGFDFVHANTDRATFLGFAIHRIDQTTNEARWLPGQLRFKGDAADFGEDVPSNRGPFQKFYWGDYTTKPGHDYQYSIHPTFGKPDKLQRQQPVVLNVTTATNDPGQIGVYFNRGLTATPAYLQRFGDVYPKDVQDNAAYQWLSRGLKEALLDFISAAAPGDELKIAIYEFELEDIIEALKKAKNLGVHIKLLFHASKSGKNNQKRTRTNRANVKLLKLAKENAIPRTNVPKISHNKFMVHVKAGKAVRVWTGSTNFTEAGLFLQTNVGLLFTDQTIAMAFDQYFELLRQNLEGKAMQAQCLQLVTGVNQAVGSNRTLFFSPVPGKDLLTDAVNLIMTAQKVVLISCPFGLDEIITDALNTNYQNILEYGLVNKTNERRLIKVLDRSINSSFNAPNWVKTFDGRAWDARARGNHKIHVKSLVVDPWDAQSKVLIGSANFSDESVNGNDENAILVTGDQRLAAIAATEFMRMFEHYKFRSHKAAVESGRKSRYLDDTGSWSDGYFDPKDSKFRARLVFSGQ